MKTSHRITRTIGALLLAVAVAGVSGAEGQESGPGIPGGATAAVMPLQSARPGPSGAWPGGGASMEETIEAFDAEMDFALGELRGGPGWASPADVVERAGRTPMIRVDPRRLAYRAILKPTDRPVRDPLHSQLRALSAILNTETVAVPLRVTYQPLNREAEGGEDAPESEGGLPTGEAGGESGESGAESAGATAAEGRAVLLLALVNTRRGRVLWHGEIRGRPGERDSSALLSTLAARVVELLNP